MQGYVEKTDIYYSISTHVITSVIKMLVCVQLGTCNKLSGLVL